MNEIKKQDDIIKNERAATMDEICNDIEEKYEKRIEELKNETELAFKVDENDLSGELTRCIYKLHTYMTKYMEEKMLLNKMSRKKDDIHGEVYGSLKKGGQMKFDSKAEIDEWINRNPKWIKICTYYDSQKVVCEFYQGLLDALKQKQWAIRNKTDLKKIELGVS
jgi:hypothetical protein